MPSIFDVQLADPGGQILQGVTSGLRERDQRLDAEDRERAGQEAAQAKKAQIGDLVERIKAGDRGAALDIAALDPKISAAIGNALEGFDTVQTKNINEWLAGYAASPDKEAYINQDSALNIDDQFRALDPEARDFTAKVFAAQSMTEQAYSAAFGQEKKTKLEQGKGKLEGYSYNPDTGIFSIQPEIKAALSKKALAAATSKKKLTARGRQSINKDVTSLLGNTQEVAKSARDLAALESSGSAAAQLAAVFKFMKSLDPTSVVRESEQGLVYSAQGVAAQFAGKLNNLIGEGKLTSAGFRDIVQTAEALANSSISASKTEVDGYLDAYEDAIPESFKGKLRDRLPEGFGDFADNFKDEADALEAELFGGAP